MGLTLVLLTLSLNLVSVAGSPRTVALWLFDEQAGIYPSCVLNDSSESDYPLALGPGGRIVKGKFGRALEPADQPAIEYPEGGSALFGLRQLPTPDGRTVPPMSWMNARFSALMTSGENHLRKDVDFANVTDTKLNLGGFDWTVEFWFQPTGTSRGPGVIFEIGAGPRGENDYVTRLSIDPDGRAFLLENRPSETRLIIPTEPSVLVSSGSWHHLAFVYSASEGQLRHYVNGVTQPLPTRVALQALSHGDEAYMSIGRDGLWKRPLDGILDELRFSEGHVYEGNFSPPSSFSGFSEKEKAVLTTLPLLWGPDSPGSPVIELGQRKHLFLDDSFVERMENVDFEVNPPRLAERVIDDIQVPFRKHLSVIEDETGLIRLYNGSYDDYLVVRTSRNGVDWEEPDLGSDYKGLRNVVIPEPTAEGNVFLDPNAPPEARWKYVSGFDKRGVFLFESPDGWSFKRMKTALLPFRSGSQSNVYYDDQRGLYIGFHRSDYATTPAGKTKREFVMTEAVDVSRPWPFHRVNQEEAREIAKRKSLHPLHPWYLDNGPLTPGGFGVEYPAIFKPDESLDPVGTDIYVPKAIKYAWAPDTYLAFPVVYFHYEADGPRTRQVLGAQSRGRGSGPIETQLSVSRDGIHWKRYARPTYVGIGEHHGRDIHQSYMAHGMVRRGNEIWQYYYGTVIYHSSWKKEETDSAVYRVVQRLDGFVSADTPYDREGLLVTKPLRFEGHSLVLNIDTDATGYAQIGFLDEKGEPIEGFSVDECIFINGDFVETEVEWMGTGTDLSGLAGRTVQLVFRMRGSKLYSMQFRKP